MLHVFSLVEVVLLLLLTVSQELEVFLSVHGAQLVFFTHFQVLNVLLVQNLVTSINLVLVAFLLLLHLVFVIGTVLVLLDVCGVETHIVV